MWKLKSRYHIIKGSVLNLSSPVVVQEVFRRPLTAENRVQS